MDIEDMTYLGAVGMHLHMLMIASGQTNTSGAHEHIWLVREKIDTELGELYEGRILFSEHDGAHSHAFGEARTEISGEHMHAVRVRGVNIASSSGGAHDHELGVQNTGVDGSHAHDLTIGGVTMQSLTVADFHMAMREKLTQGEVEPPAVMRSSGGFDVVSDGKTLSKHVTRQGAEKAAELHHFLAKCGFHTEIADSEVLSKSTDLLIEKSAPKTVTGSGLLGKMDQLLKDVEGTGVSRF